MSMTDPLGDMLTRIRNGQRARLDSVTVPGLAAARQRARRAAARGLHPRLFDGRAAAGRDASCASS